MGINNRDLRTFETDLGVTEHLLPAIPAGTLVISESGVHEPARHRRSCTRAGARGFLIGEALMRSGDPAAFVDEVKQTRPSSRP